MNFRLFQTSVTSLLLITGSLFGEQPGVADKPQRTFRLISIVGSYEGLFYKSNHTANAQPIVIGPFLSPVLPVPGNSQVEIYRLIPPPSDAPGAPPTQQVVLKANLPADGFENIIVARPLIPKSKTTLFEPQVIPVPKDYQAGTCLLVNFSPFENVAYAIKEKIYTLGTGEIQLVPINQGITSLKIAVNAGNNWALAGGDAWRISPKHRGYVLVFPYIEDPDAAPLPLPPPAWARVNFEVSPETRVQPSKL